MRLLSCPHISRVHCKRVNIPLSSVCSGLTQHKVSRRSKGAGESGRISGGGGVTVVDAPPAVCRLEAFCAPSGSQTQIMLPSPRQPPSDPSRSHFNPRIRPFFQGAERKGGGGRGARLSSVSSGRSALLSLTGVRRSLCKHLPARVYLDSNRSRAVSQPPSVVVRKKI